MKYEPSVEAVYEACTESSYDNHRLRGCREETVLGAIYQLGQEYDGICRNFEQVSNDRYRYIADINADRPRIRARIFLSRYLSAVYRLIEAIRVCFSSAADEQFEGIKLKPDMHGRSRWDGDGGSQGENWDWLCDKVMTRFTYLRGLRNAVVHGTNDGFDAEHDEETGVLLSVNPSELDDDPALRGSNRNGNRKYSFTDMYFRFEKTREEAVYPVDNIMKYHEEIIFPFVQAFGDEL